MDFEMACILRLLGEMNSFSKTNDELSAIVDYYDDSELTENDLSLVSAAHAPRPFSELLKNR